MCQQKSEFLQNSFTEVVAPFQWREGTVIEMFKKFKKDEKVGRSI